MKKLDVLIRMQLATQIAAGLLSRDQRTGADPAYCLWFVDRLWQKAIETQTTEVAERFMDQVP